MKLGNQLWGITLQPADKIRFIRSQIEFKLLALAAGLDRRSSDTGDRQSRHAFSRRACFLLGSLRSCQNCEKRTFRNLIDRAGTFGLGCMSYSPTVRTTLKSCETPASWRLRTSATPRLVRSAPSK